LGALALLILGVFGGGYWLLVRYEPKAALHIPNSALGAIRVDVEQVVLYEPIRKHIFPVLDGGDSGDRLKRFKALSGVNLGMDLREIVVALLPEGEVVVAIGGLFPTVGLVQALHQLSQSDDGATKCSLDGLSLRCANGVLRQADDGTLVIATSTHALESALGRADWAQRNGLPAAPLAFVMNTADNPLLSSFGGLGRLGQIAWLRDVKRLTAWTDLGDPLQAELALDGLGADRVSDVRAAVAMLQTWAALNPGVDVAGEREVLSRLSVDVAAGRPVIRSIWSRGDLERAVRAVADLVGAALRPFQPS
jgi:hypothetical protein